MNKKRAFVFSNIFLCSLTLLFGQAIDQERKKQIDIYCSEADIFIRNPKPKLLEFFGPRPTDILFIDLNKDGISDLIVQDRSAEGSIHLFDGQRLRKNNKFNFEENDLELGTDYRNAGIGLGDFNGDGFKDILIFRPPSSFNHLNNWFYIIFGSADIFSSRIPDYKRNFKDSTYELQDISNFADVRGFSSNRADSETDGQNNSKLNLIFADINNDGLDDVVCSCPYATTYNKNQRLRSSGKVFVLFGREIISKKIDLAKNADITISGYCTKLNLGLGLKALVDSKENEVRTDLFIQAAGSLHIVPDVNKMSGGHIINQIPNHVELLGEGDLFSLTDINRDNEADLIIQSPYSVSVYDNLDPHRHETHMLNDGFPLLRFVYKKSNSNETKKKLNDISDTIIIYKPEKRIISVDLHWFGDLDGNGKHDAIFVVQFKKSIFGGKEAKKEFLLLMDLTDKGKIVNIIEDASMRIDNPAGFHAIQYSDLTGNNIQETIITAPEEEVTRNNSKLKSAGKVFLFVDRIIPFDKLLDNSYFLQSIQTADIVICGEVANERMGTAAFIYEISGDGIKDLVIVSPSIQLYDGIGNTPRYDRGAIYIFFGENIKKIRN